MASYISRIGEAGKLSVSLNDGRFSMPQEVGVSSSKQRLNKILFLFN